jgi:hypothetical protein
LMTTLYLNSTITPFIFGCYLLLIASWLDSTNNTQFNFLWCSY